MVEDISLSGKVKQIKWNSVSRSVCDFDHTLFCLLLFVVVMSWNVLCFISAQNLEITCPSSGFTVGDPATVTCAVNKTAFETTCLRPPTLVKFHFTPSNGVSNEWCTANYSICNGTGVADRLCGKCSCGCKEGNENLIVHRLEFIPTSEHAAGSFSCAVVCLQKGNLPPLTKNNCDRVTVGKLIVTQFF